MITVVNDKNQAQYDVLFENATASLLTAEGIDYKADFIVVDNIDSDLYNNNPNKYYINSAKENEEPNYILASGAFNEEETYYKPVGIQTLENFFCSLKDLYRINPKYIMLPLDEEPFEIDANKRTISIPSSFKSGVSVQGDIVAETLLFRIDRFFDAIDFNDCNIFVQWEHQNKPDVKYVTPIEDLIDIESQPGKIIFGWPLSASVTSVSGPIKFSVRLIKYNNENTIAYSFSTLTSTITINQGLDYNINESTRDSANQLFDLIITNSETSLGAAAARPFFERNLDTAISYLGDDGTLTLEVMADSTDTGNIRYEWRASANEEALGKVIKEEAPDDRQNSTYIVDVENPAIEDGVVGYYWAKAINRFTNKEKSAFSKTTFFPGANEPVFATDLKDTMLQEGSASLAVEMAADEHGEHNKVTYAWEKKNSTSDDVAFDAIDSAVDAEYITLAPGVYRVKVTNTVNADEKSIYSKECVVYDAPAAVEFTNSENSDLVRDQEYTLEVVTPSDEFKRGDITYSWWIDYDASGSVLTDGKPSQTDKKVEYAHADGGPTIKITSQVENMVGIGFLHCVAANTITIDGMEPVTTYSESQAYRLITK